MFTGIVEELGTVSAVEGGASGARLCVQCATVLSDLSVGASVAVNGVCLTVVSVSSSGFEADLAAETLRRSNLGDLQSGARVNLERPVTPATRLSGHIVQGHVDATATLVSVEELGEGNCWLNLRVAPQLDRYLVEKGSIAIDGISLTIAAIEADIIGVAIIPHTRANTTLGCTKPGDRMNIEVDVLAKHVEKLLRRSSE